MKTRKRSVMGLVGSAAAVLITTLTTGCLDRELTPLNPCLVSGVTAEVRISNVDKVDILFMVDNSNSMSQEQDALKAQFPKLVTTLVTGERMPGDPNPFPPAKDLHLAVVSSDMGLVGGKNGMCHDFGDDGIMRDPAGNAAKGLPACDGGVMGQRFLAYTAKNPIDLKAAMTFATNFGCLATLGTGGCGFEQQLESTLKALWPKNDFNVEKGTPITPNRITFLGLQDATHTGSTGHGDVENKGFLRNNGAEGLSLVAIILVTDEEDCSAAKTGHLLPKGQIDPKDPNFNIDLNLRCFKNPQNLYKIDERYVPGFRALRQGSEQLIVYAAIVGVPADLVTPEKRKAVDFTDKTQRDAYYDSILADTRMQNTVDPTRKVNEGNLKPSCMSTTGGIAYPPRRMVELAKAMGENSVVQSICQENFGPAMDAIIEVIAKQLGAVCLPKQLVRKADNKVGCNVVWELPSASNTAAPRDAPRDCGGTRPYLVAPDKGRALVNKAGGKNCKVVQLPADKDMRVIQKDPETGLSEGWYYDDFTDELMKSCSPSTPQRVAFSAMAAPPNGVTVKLECLNETQTVASNRSDVDLTVTQPEIGTPCSGVKDAGGKVIPKDTVCLVRLNDGKTDSDMFCHPELNVCVRSCSGDSDCPPAWVCDKRGDTIASTKGGTTYPMGSAICVNPTCGTD